LLTLILFAKNLTFQMKNSKLIQLLKTFGPKDLQSFSKYLNSPFLKPERNVIEFFKYLKKYSPEYNSDKLDKEKVFKNLFPSLKYKENILVNHMYELTKAVEKFLVHNALLQNESEFLLNLSKVYLDNKLPKHSEFVNKNMETILKPGFSLKKDFISRYRRLTQLKSLYYTGINDFDNLIKSRSDYFIESAIQFVMDYIDIEGSKAPAKSHGKDFNDPFLEEILECFDIEKLIVILKKEELRKKEERKEKEELKQKEELVKKVQLKKKGRLSKKELEKQEELRMREEKKKEEVEEKLRKKEDARILYVSLYNRLLKMLKEPKNPEHYYALKQLFYENLKIGDSLPHNENLKIEDSTMDTEEKNTIFNYLINYCTQQLNLDFMKESFDLHKNMIERRLYAESENGYMQLHVFRNVIIVCGSVKETEWFEYFIENFINELSPEFRENLKEISYAHLYFMKGEYEKSLSCISKIKDKFELSKTDIRNLQLKLHYELGNTEAAFALVHAYTEFLSNAKDMPEENKLRFSNFVKFYLQLLKLGPNAGETELGYLENKINNESKMSNQTWLIEKINKLRQ